MLTFLTLFVSLIMVLFLGVTSESSVGQALSSTANFVKEKLSNLSQTLGISQAKSSEEAGTGNGEDSLDS